MKQIHVLLRSTPSAIDCNCYLVTKPRPHQMLVIHCCTVFRQEHAEARLYSLEE